LRARAFTTNYLEAFEKNDAAMNLEVYDNALEQINSFQLELEMIVKELESNGRSFSDASSLRVNITKMENYLGEIVSEYEENRIKGFENNSIAMQHLKEIKTLIEHTVDKSAFRLQFIEPYKVAVGAIRRELLLENHS
ncbi:MAG: hypothetical protein ABI416_04900, partial [Ginsengibacter sp.]